MYLSGIDIISRFVPRMFKVVRSFTTSKPPKNTYINVYCLNIERNMLFITLKKQIFTSDK